MPKFAFVIESLVSFATEVEAATLEEAITIAKQRDIRPLCHACLTQAKDAWSPGDIEFDAEYSRLVDMPNSREEFDQAVETWGHVDDV